MQQFELLETSETFINISVPPRQIVLLLFSPLGKLPEGLLSRVSFFLTFIFV